MEWAGSHIGEIASHLDSPQLTLRWTLPRIRADMGAARD